MTETNDPPALVKTELDRGILRVTLDSPHNRNALSLALVEQLVAALDRARTEPGIRAVVLTGSGPTFCAGADLKEDPSKGPARAARMIDMLDGLGSSPVPVVVQLNGNVRAGGLGILGAADVVVAPDTATFAFTEVRIGVVPAIIAITILPRMDARAAQRYFLTGEEFDAKEAARCGLVTMVAPAAEVASTVDGLLDCFRKAAPSALAATKQLLRDRALVRADREGLASAAALSASIFMSDDAREGMLAFREKRPPRWAV
ncbi:MAG: crt7 [Labilithrix sp.]|nr:crt7 [Labilithrix sp.]